jgi:hypothetical protein
VNTESERIAHLLAAANQEAADELRGIAETATSKEISKAARKALYLLSQRHITPSALPENVDSAGVSSPHTISARAFASAYDGAGNRAVYFGVPDPDGGSPTFVQFLINDETGIKDFGARKLTRREMASVARNLEEQLEEGIAFAEIESDYALHLLISAYAVNLRLKSATPRGTLEWIGRLGAPQQDYPVAPVYARLSAAEAQADTDLAYDPDDLFRVPWFDPWFLEVAQVMPWLDRLLAGMDYSPVTTEQDQRDQAEQATGEAVDALVVDETRARYIHRLEESADILLRRGKEMVGRQALYHAQELRSELPASQILFARRLVERTITVALTLVAQNRG